ncbi:hypothetical protein F2Q65_03985 [Thiohalocapsa marina]|uniref:Uncharacterized protein n=1 Tax=Thiohalocapsa marina TaxID=424902 RepID=A0A5M8FTG7_9GAMM|nr:hypothetical protein F2Q65_03985 [Thiohalocapsa marina]
MPAPGVRAPVVLLLVALLSGVLWPGIRPAYAHKLNVFAAADGTWIEGSTYFAGGAGASGARIRVTDASGALLAELESAADGRFRFQASGPQDHRVIARIGDGHRAEWLVTAEELAGGFAPAQAETLAPAMTNAPVADQPVLDSAIGDAVTGDAATGAADSAVPVTLAAPPPGPEAAGLEAAIEAAVARQIAQQIRPLREELLATRDALRLQDVLGGIGYIFGLAGLALWWKARRNTSVN